MVLKEWPTSSCNLAQQEQRFLVCGPSHVDSTMQQQCDDDKPGNMFQAQRVLSLGQHPLLMHPSPRSSQAALHFSNRVSNPRHRVPVPCGTRVIKQIAVGGFGGRGCKRTSNYSTALVHVCAGKLPLHRPRVPGCSPRGGFANKQSRAVSTW
jgi:hypothetical protein